MENVIPLLFTLYVIGIVISAIVKKLREVADEPMAQPIDPPAPFHTPVDSDEPIQTQPSTLPERSVTVPPSMEEESILDTDFEEDFRGESLRESKPHSRMRFNRRQAREGVIYSEVLGPPRALKPFRLPLDRR